MDEKYIDNRIKELVNEHNAIVDTISELDNNKKEMEIKRLQIIGSINELKIMKDKLKEDSKDNKEVENKNK